MIKTKKSAVTAISYGLIAALVAVVSLGALATAGVDIENVFSITGNAMAATSTASPNSNLNSEQQSQITNAAAEIAAGTASATCLQYMNDAANASNMASNGATCLGPGYGIAPPALPLKFEADGASGNEAVEPNGLIYANVWDGLGSFSSTSASASAGSSSIIAYRDGQEMSGGYYYPARVTQCQTGSYGGYSNTVGSPTVINGNELVCAGIMDNPGWAGSGSNASADAPLGYETPW